MHFSATGAQMQVSSASTQSAMDTITVDIPKSQVVILAKKGANLVDQGGNSYSTNAMPVLNRKSLKNSNDGASKKNFNGYINPPYLLDTLSYHMSTQLALIAFFGLTHTIGGAEEKYI